MNYTWTRALPSARNRKLIKTIPLPPQKPPTHDLCEELVGGNTVGNQNNNGILSICCQKEGYINDIEKIFLHIYKLSLFYKIMTDQNSYEIPSKNNEWYKHNDKSVAKTIILHEQLEDLFKLNDDDFYNKYIANISISVYIKDTVNFFNIQGKFFKINGLNLIENMMNYLLVSNENHIIKTMMEEILVSNGCDDIILDDVLISLIDILQVIKFSNDMLSIPILGKLLSLETNKTVKQYINTVANITYSDINLKTKNDEKLLNSILSLLLFFISSTVSYKLSCGKTNINGILCNISSLRLKYNETETDENFNSFISDSFQSLDVYKIVDIITIFINDSCVDDSSFQKILNTMTGVIKILKVFGKANKKN